MISIASQAEREVLPELLDALPHDDPAALRSRKELRFINRIMGNHRWLCNTLSHRGLRGCRILELGAGDGLLAKRAMGNGMVASWQWTALDLIPAPADWPRGAGWHQRDLMDLMALPALPDAEIVLANLFLHHFQDEELASLGRRLPDTCRDFIACEPARRKRHTVQGHLLSLVARLSRVTHHDMLVSIRPGFVRDELPRLLGLHGWRSVVTFTALGACRLAAWR